MALDILMDLARSLGIFTKLKNKLIARPDPAAEQLAEVLGKITDSFEAINTELKNYLGLWFDVNNPNQLAKERRKLLDLEDGSAGARIEEKRIHCHEIRQIYDDYLDTWFKKTFDKTEYEQIKQLFQYLSNADYKYFDISRDLGDWLKIRARRILDMYDQKNYAGANEEILNDRKEISADRDKLVEIIKALYKAQGEFVKVSKAK